MSAILGSGVLVVAALLASADGARRAAAEAVPGGKVVTMRPDAVGNRPVWRLTVAGRRGRADVVVDGLTGTVVDPATVAEGRVARADGRGRAARADGRGRAARADGRGRVARADGRGRAARADGRGRVAPADGRAAWGGGSEAPAN